MYRPYHLSRNHMHFRELNMHTSLLNFIYQSIKQISELLADKKGMHQLETQAPLNE